MSYLRCIVRGDLLVVRGYLIKGQAHETVRLTAVQSSRPVRRNSALTQPPMHHQTPHPNFSCVATRLITHESAIRHLRTNSFRSHRHGYRVVTGSEKPNVLLIIVPLQCASSARLPIVTRRHSIQTVSTSAFVCSKFTYTCPFAPAIAMQHP